MVDKALFLGSNGASASMHQLEIITNNLANVNTTGFREDYESMKQYQVKDNGDQTRTFTMSGQSYSDFRPGPVIKTGRSLDVAISGKGFIAVQSKQQGKEGYTRAGDLQLTTDGFLTTRAGDMVMGSSGPIQIPQSQNVAIGADGTISAVVKGQTLPITVARIKLTNPPITNLQKGTDGLFYMTGSAGASKQDDKIKLTPGAIEGSNVNPVETLTSLIELSRQFEMHTNLMKNIQDNATKANELLQLP